MARPTERTLGAVLMASSCRENTPGEFLVDSAHGHSLTSIDVNGRHIPTNGGALDADTVLLIAEQPSHSVVIRLIEGRAVHFDPHYPVIIPHHKNAVFRCFADSAVFQLKVSGEWWDWGAPTICANDIRAITGVGSGLMLSRKSAVFPLDASAIIDLAACVPPDLEFRSLGYPEGKSRYTNSYRAVSCLAGTHTECGSGCATDTKASAA